jgi:hypothetical protein
MKMLSLSLLLLSSIAFGMNFSLIPAKAVPGIGPVDVLYNESGFYVIKDGYLDHVSSHNVDPELRVMDMAKIKAFAKMGSIKVSQNDHQEYILRMSGKLPGSGPILATAAGISVRAVGYGTFIVAIFATKGEVLLHTHEICEMVEIAANTASTAALLAPTP